LVVESGEHITCQEVVELVTDHLEGALTAQQMSLFEQHLNFCEGCVWYVDQLRATVEGLGTLIAEDVPADTRERLVGAFREWKRR
jgi:predicted anti-sigma-YlaC factor YlaD